MSPELRIAVESAAVVEANRLCERAAAGLVKLEADSAVAPWLPRREVRLDRAKRAQIEAFSRTSRRVERVVCDIGSGKWTDRDEFLGAVNLYCAAGIAAVEHAFASMKG